MEIVQVHMALKNMFTNAVEAIDSKGTLTVKIERTKDGQAEISFKDTGQGIVSGNLEKIFQPLFSTKAQGIGFGLSISKIIIENHGGSIKVESEPGKGTKFIIRLPLHNKEGGIANE
ncbi:MAG: ATP-binding protein [Desulfobacteria bacterium]